MRSRVSWLAGRPRISMVPESGPSTFRIMRSVVVLPAPLGPRRPKATPRGTDRDRSCTAWWPEKALFTPERRIASSLTPAFSARASWGRRVYHRAFAGIPREREGRGRARGRTACVPSRRADEAARRRAPLRDGAGADPRPLPDAPQPRSAAREGRRRPLQPSPPQAVGLRRLDARPRAGGHALVGVFRRLRRPRRLRE